MLRRSSVHDLFGVFNGLNSLFDRNFEGVFPGGEMNVKFLPSGADKSRSPAATRPLTRFGSSYGVFPAVESFEKDGNIHVRAEVPGVEPSNLNVSIIEDRLTISGVRESSKEVEEADFHLREMSHGSFERQFTLPEGVDTDRVRAVYQNGMLELIVPLPVESKPKEVKIAVKSGDKKGLLK